VGNDLIAVVYVDDILFFARDDSRIEQTIELLKTKGVAIRREGTAEGFLGVDIERSVTNSGRQQIRMIQKGLTQRVITALGLDSNLSTSISTPAEASPLPKDVNGEPEAGNINYAATVGMLLYLSGHSRPDIAFAVHQCARYTFKLLDATSLLSSELGVTSKVLKTKAVSCCHRTSLVLTAILMQILQVCMGMSGLTQCPPLFLPPPRPEANSQFHSCT
jgi:hypothetical protein